MVRWKSICGNVEIDKSHLIKEYGIVKRNGKTFYRNYHRKLKSDGLSLIDLLNKKIQKTKKDISDALRLRIN